MVSSPASHALQSDWVMGITRIHGQYLHGAVQSGQMSPSNENRPHKTSFLGSKYIYTKKAFAAMALPGHCLAAYSTARPIDKFGNDFTEGWKRSGKAGGKEVAKRGEKCADGAPTSCTPIFGPLLHH